MVIAEEISLRPVVPDVNCHGRHKIMKGPDPQRRAAEEDRMQILMDQNRLPVQPDRVFGRVRCSAGSLGVFEDEGAGEGAEIFVIIGVSERARFPQHPAFTVVGDMDIHRQEFGERIHAGQADQNIVRAAEAGILRIDQLRIDREEGFGQTKRDESPGAW